MNELNISESAVYKTFNRQDFPAIKVGKKSLVMLLPYLIWKMERKDQRYRLLKKGRPTKNENGAIYYDKDKKRWECWYYVVNPSTLKKQRKCPSTRHAQT